MASLGFLHALVQLAACESVDELLQRAVFLLQAELQLTAHVELWDASGQKFVSGKPNSSDARYRAWIGTRYTHGAIYVYSGDVAIADLELLALQLAPLGEFLIEQYASTRRTIREDIKRVYDRRIRDALVRFDWNASEVARELSVSRRRVAEVSRRWRRQ
jgi:hypothetical protein